MSEGLLIALALVAVVAVIAAWRFARSASAWREEAGEATAAMQRAQDELEQGRADAELGQTLVGIAEHLKSAPAAPAADPLAAIGDAIGLHCRRVRAYDAAVQYCLQPVELMPAADTDDLEKLVKFVSDARRRLFVARAELLGDHALDKLAALTATPTAPQASAGSEERKLIVALADVASASRGGCDVASVLKQVATLTRARSVDRVEQFDAEIAVLPPMAAPNWLATVLLRLLDLTAEVAGEGGELSLHARARDDGGIDIEAEGQTSHSLPATHFEAFVHELDDLRHRLDERGIELESLSLDPRSRGFTSRGFVLHLPGGGHAVPSAVDAGDDETIATAAVDAVPPAAVATSDEA